MKAFLAIDFGTTHTTVARLTESSKYEPEIVEIDGKKTIDTALRLDDKGTVTHFGNEAMEGLNAPPGTTFYNFKAFVGSDKSYGNLDKSYSAEELSLIFLTYLRQKIEKRHFNDVKLAEVDDLYCVIGCPAEWNEIQKNKIAEIAREAGFPNAIYCDEPLGVIYYYHYRGDISLKEEQNVLVYDFGGGTTDLAVEKLLASESYDCKPKLLAAGGVTDLGGKDFDDALVSHFMTKMGIEKQSLEHRDLQTLEKYSRMIKEKLSLLVEDGSTSTEITIPMLFSKRSSYTLSLTKEEFEGVCGDLIGKFEKPIYDVLNKAAISQKDIHRVILAGGSSLLYYVKQRANEMFCSNKILASANPLEVIAKGLALYGRVCACGAATLDVTRNDVNEKKRAGTECQPTLPNHAKSTAKTNKLFYLLPIILLLAVFTFFSSGKTQPTTLGRDDIIRLCQQNGEFNDGVAFAGDKGKMGIPKAREIYSYIYYDLSWWETIKNWAPGAGKNASGIFMCSDKIYWSDKQGTKNSMEYSALRNDPSITRTQIGEIASSIVDDEVEQNKIISTLLALQSAK